MLIVAYSRRGENMKLTEFNEKLKELGILPLKQASETQNNISLKHMEKPSHKICLAAVTYNGRALQHVKSKHQTPELCIAALKNDSYARQYVSFNIFT